MIKKEYVKYRCSTLGIFKSFKNIQVQEIKNIRSRALIRFFDLFKGFQVQEMLHLLTLAIIFKKLYQLFHYSTTKRKPYIYQDTHLFYYIESS